ncbi:HopJ type III effector protein [Paraburkholderia hospita]|uniref:Type III effector n=1 Tax=Paraburkholderia hospita TaxID=169430 RepID=A0AAN1JDA0_9BURK|nr:HopJ type III effector protein [Paraburkholderia hospita]AUT71238.1 type III effector [Paraburkholderia hospita]EIM96012.1 HopJ type III effector protein [Paraburkholderia hospita]OUL75448.1 type III effector [Paraburkholderia hospita]SEI26825.1 HopJ type III effector protein [Paraburkholderia hospita]
MKLDILLKNLTDNPTSVTLDDALAAIPGSYKSTPVAFENGGVRYQAGQNVRSCQLLAFAMLHNLTKEQTLNCYGIYYREDVLRNPTGTDHEPIRNFMKHGWDGVQFDAMPLEAR